MAEFTEAQMIALLDRAEPRLRRRFLSAIQLMNDAAPLSAIESALTTGTTDQILDALDDIWSETFPETWNGVFIEAGSTTSAAIGEGTGAIVSFNQVNSRAVATMQDADLRLIREFSQQQRQASRQALVRGASEGLNPRETARRFRDSIGLTARQEEAVSNYRRLLRENPREALARRLRDRRFDGRITRAAAGEIELTDAEIERMVTRYRERYVRHRSEVIARTEALRAVHEANEESFAQAIEAGRVDPTTLRREWIPANDERVRDSHDAMRGQVRMFGELFVTGQGNLLRYPGDSSAPAEETVLCRCVISTTFLPPVAIAA